MPAPHTLLLFAAAALGLLVIPGPAVLYIVTRSIDQGRSAGVASVLGIHTGSLVHVAAAALGLSALLVSSAVAFSVVKYAGAAYLVVLGIRKLLERDDPTVAVTGAPPRTLRSIYLQGIVVNVLNPKTALFFLAFLPQFVDQQAGHVGLQMLFLGLVFVALAIVSDGTWVLVAGTASDKLRGHTGFLRAQRWVSGTVFVGLGVATALTGSHRSTTT
jgi:threonine/homoserine/homoserine lactone efflux protein